MTLLLATLNAKYIHTNLAIRMLYELNSDWPGLAWKEFTIKEDREALADYCARYDVVAFSCYIWNITHTLDAARRIKAINPAVKILLGGPEVSYEWQEVLADPAVDFIITGEGETPFSLFLRHYPNVADVPGIAFKTDGGMRHNPEAGMFDLQQYEGRMLYHYDPPEELRSKVLYLETSRGCPYKCEFCLASLDNKVRYLPIETLKANLLYLMQHGRVIKFLDRTFNIKRDFTLDIFQFILDNHRPDNVFQFEITADILHPDIIRFICEKVPKGLFRFEIGIQSVKREVNLEVSRKQNFEKTKAIIQSLSDYVDMHLDLIVGLPLEYWADVKYSFESVFALFAPELQLGFLKFLKGTPMRQEKHAQHEFVYDPAPPYQIIQSKYLSREELHRLELLEHALEIYWNKKRAAFTLRYVTGRYGSFDFLLGLGELFAERHVLHQHSLQDVYSVLQDFVAMHYPEDKVLHTLVSLDYYLYHKVKPKTIFLPELGRAEKNQILDNKAYNRHRYRYLVLSIPFDWPHFEQTCAILPASGNLVIQYDGLQKARIVGWECLVTAF